MSIVSNLGRAKRQMFLFNERHNQLGQLVEDGKTPIKFFREWKDNVYEPAFKKAVTEYINARDASRNRVDLDVPWTVLKTDLRGKIIVYPATINLGYKAEVLSYLLRLKKLQGKQTGTIELSLFDIYIGKAHVACALKSTFDAEIRNSDEYKKL